MDEKKFAVMLTDTQEIKTLECDPQEELFEIARGTIGCEWIELVEAEPLAKDGYLMLIDEEGKLKKGPVSINSMRWLPPPWRASGLACAANPCSWCPIT